VVTGAPLLVTKELYVMIGVDAGSDEGGDPDVMQEQADDMFDGEFLH